MSGAFNFPIVMTPAGLQPQAPADILAQLLASVAATNPGYTGDLPASLIEDIASTDVGAIVLIDRARVELINSLTPNGANDFVLNQLGQIYGVQPGIPTNTSVNVVFTGTVGFVINVGFQVSDGTNTYQIVDGGVIGGGGSSPSLTAVAVNSGSFAVPLATVTQIVTSVPGAITLSVTNPTAGTPGGAAETSQSYRSRVLQAGLASSQGMPRYLKTLIQNLPGVVSRTVAVRATLGTGIEVLVAGGDNYQIAYAIFRSVFDPSALIASSTYPGNNVTVSISDYPDTYNMVFVTPEVHVVTIALTWNTWLTDFVQGAAVAQIAQQPLADVINSYPTGAPINLIDLDNAFIAAVSSILNATDISKLNFTLHIDGSPVSTISGEKIYTSDPEGYYTCATTAVVITQG